MRFSTTADDFLDALKTVRPAVPSSTTVPILECIRFQLVQGRIRLSTTDLEVRATDHLDATIDKQADDNGPVGIKAKRLYDTLRALPGSTRVDLRVTDDLAAHLTTDSGEYQLMGEDGEDYPERPDLDDADLITLNSAILKRAIEKTDFAVSDDALRPAMTGTLVHLEPGGSRVVATDGHRLVRLELPQVQPPTEMKFILPQPAAKLARRIADGDACSIRLGDGHVKLSFGDASVTARLIDETYPNWQAVVPDDNDKRMVAERDDLLGAVQRVGLYTPESTSQVRLNIESNRVRLTGEDVQANSEAEEVVQCDYDSGEMEIGFNAVYLAEVLENAPAGEVRLELDSPNRAGLVRPLSQPDDQDLLMLIMPVMLNKYA